ncbi:MAG TPA: acyl carrier protein [Hyphomicrobiaceae bacterium]|nr:acyl carrier protein [Hyphomicrobiaceae bacterium]
MTPQEILSELRSVLDDLAPGVKLDEAHLDTRLSEVGYDSLDLANFLLAIDEKYGVKISDDEAVELGTLRGYSRHIAEKTA